MSGAAAIAISPPQPFFAFLITQKKTADTTEVAVTVDIAMFECGNDAVRILLSESHSWAVPGSQPETEVS